jgi:GAF domain-containing protein
VREAGFIRDRQVVMRNVATRERVYIAISATRVRDDDGHLVGAQYLLCNVTAKMGAIEELRQRNQELAALDLIAEATSQSLDLDDVLNSSAGAALTALGTPAVGWIHLYDDDAQLRQKVEYRFMFDQPTIEAAALRTELASEVAIKRQPLLLTTSGDRRLLRLGGQAFVSVPLYAHESVSGALGVLALTERSYSDEDVHLLTLLSPRIGAAIHNACLYTKLAAQLHQSHQSAPA